MEDAVFLTYIAKQIQTLHIFADPKIVSLNIL